LSKDLLTEAVQADKKSRSIWQMNLAVWAALMLLVLLTLWFAYLPLGRFNMPLAMLISAAKTFLITAIFMELRLAKGFVRLAAAAAFLWIAVMFILTFSDLMSRAG
jgi:cytochrome c oxidase subunit IV